MVTFKETTYKNYGKCLEISNGCVDLLVTPAWHSPPLSDELPHPMPKPSDLCFWKTQTTQCVQNGDQTDSHISKDSRPHGGRSHDA